MSLTPEEQARQNIDALLATGGWIVQDRHAADITTGRGVAIREFPLRSGFGEADYLLFVDGAAAGVIEAKKEGGTLTGFEGQTAKYSEGLPPGIPAPRHPLPFLYQSTGIETRFTSLLDPDARSRNVFAFHRPETLADWLQDELQHPGTTLRAQLRHLPPLAKDKLRPAQITAIENLEVSLADQRPRALIQMASGGGKTYTACNVAYRLHVFSYDELIKRDKVSLDIFWLKDDSLEDSANLPDPDVIAGEIAEDLQAALDQFLQIAAELKSK